MNMIDEKEFIKQNNIRVNRKIKYIFWSSLLVGPLISIGSYFGIFCVEYRMILRVIIGCLLLNVIYYFLNLNIKYHNITRYFAMILLETFIVVISTYQGVGIYITYGLVPLMSCVYYDHKFSRNICIMCYFFMVISLYVRSFDESQVFNQVNPNFTPIVWFISFGLGFTIEYIFVFITVMIVSKYAKTFFDALFNQNIENINVKTQVKIKNDFFASMSHEIRTPINAIIGMDEMILEESNEEVIREYAQNIKDASESLLSTVNDILDVSKMEAHKLRIINNPYDVYELIKDEVDLVKLKMQKKGLTFNVEISQDMPSVLYGDEMRIKQVMTNILSNAFKYTQKGFINIYVSCIYTKVEDIKEYDIYQSDIQEYVRLVIAVEDTGVGIKQEALSSIFESFERVDEERNRKIQGTGLGMNITAKLVNLMYGYIDVESIYGEGSTFTVEIPQGIVDKTPIKNTIETYKEKNIEKKPYQVDFIAPNAKILVVDDNEMNLAVVKALLKKYKVQLQTAGSGRECLELVKHNRYDIIFLDHMMPEMDGIETLNKMKVQKENISRESKVIALTANAIKGAREKYLEAGFEDYVEKPINSKILGSIIQKNLSQDLIEFIKKENEEFSNVAFGLFENMEEIIENVGGLDTYNEILKNYYLAIDCIENEINEYFEKIDVDDNLKNYTIKVHALKSSAKTIGAKDLAELAQEMEYYGKNGEVDKIKLNHNMFLEKQMTIKSKIEPYVLSLIQNESSEECMIRTKEELVEKFKDLETAIENMDIDLADEIVAQIDKTEFSHKFDKLNMELKESILNINIDRAKELIGFILKNI
ncbi:MAG: response regulator [Clostridium sp.]|nr:response regulator [Clostridium sp.]